MLCCGSNTGNIASPVPKDEQRQILGLDDIVSHGHRGRDKQGVEERLPIKAVRESSSEKGISHFKFWHWNDARSINCMLKGPRETRAPKIMLDVVLLVRASQEARVFGALVHAVRSAPASKPSFEDCKNHVFGAMGAQYGSEAFPSLGFKTAHTRGNLGKPPNERALQLALENGPVNSKVKSALDFDSFENVEINGVLQSEKGALELEFQIKKVGPEFGRDGELGRGTLLKQ